MIDFPSFSPVSLVAGLTYVVAVEAPGCVNSCRGADVNSIEFRLYSESSPSNVTLTDGNQTLHWSLANALNSSNSPQTALLNTAAINNFLTTCTADASGNCSVPLRFFSDTIGQLQINSYDIRYPHLHIPSASTK